MNDYIKKYIKYKHKYIKLLKAGSANASVALNPANRFEFNPAIRVESKLKEKDINIIVQALRGHQKTLQQSLEMNIESLKQSIKHTKSESLRLPYNKVSYGNKIVLNFVEKFKEFIKVEKILSFLLTNLIKFNSCSSSEASCSSELHYQPSKFSNYESFNKTFIKLLTTNDTHFSKMLEKYLNDTDYPSFSQALDYLHFLNMMKIYITYYQRENTTDRMRTIIHTLLETDIDSNDHRFEINFINPRIDMLFKLNLPNNSFDTTYSLRETCFDRFFYDLKSNTIVKLTHLVNKSIQISSNGKECIYNRADKLKKIIITSFVVNDSGDRLGNVLFDIINFMLHCYDKIKNYPDVDYFLISVTEDYYNESVWRWPNIGFSFVENPSEFYQPQEIMSSFIKTKSRFSPIPFLYYLTNEDQIPIKGIKAYFDTPTYDIRKRDIIRDNKTIISVSIRASDFCSGQTSCFHNTDETKTIDNQGIGPAFPILSIEYYINCLDHIVKEGISKGLTYSNYTIVIFYLKTTVDYPIILLYKEIFKQRYPSIEVLLEEDYLNYDPEGTEIDIIRAAGSSQIVICSNSTFSYYMVVYKLINYTSGDAIYYPRDFIYGYTYFLDFDFTSSYAIKSEDFVMFDPNKESIEKCKIELRKKLHSKFKLHACDSPYYICYLPKINVYSQNIDTEMINYTQTYNEENPFVEHVVDTVRILLFFISICKINYKFKINKKHCNLQIFNLLNPYLTYQIEDDNVCFIPNLKLIKNNMFKKLIEDTEFNDTFITNLLKFLKILSFNRDKKFKYYESMRFTSEQDNFFTMENFENTTFEEYTALEHQK